MNLNTTINKKILEKIINKTFSNFGLVISSNLLDSLKLFGFHYATNAGISINIEDLRTPEIKNFYIQEINNYIKNISYNWFEGNISNEERFQNIITRWSITSETLKAKIIKYYQKFDPVNNLFIMAFSGARGNMSQVHQLVGMRGLMADQFGNIIDLPIQSNFREGLNLVDYIVSAYGARKGIVDTALKTADSGYLTRRLVYLAQDLIIREVDCNSKKGITVLITKNNFFNYLIGQKILYIKKYKYPFKKFFFKNLIINLNILERLRPQAPLFITIRSVLTCTSNGSLCQKCYGLDLSKQKKIALGSTVGIIAAQSIGEPGTQLTMRTFHTGGTFTGSSFKYFNAPFSGILKFLTNLETELIRTNSGNKGLKINQNIILNLENWKGYKTNIVIKSDIILNILKTGFIYKNDQLGEIIDNTITIKRRKIEPIYIRSSGKIISKKLKKNKIFLLDPYKLSFLLGNLGIIPVESKFIFSKNIIHNKTIAILKIITPINGIISIKNSFITIRKENEFFNINLNQLIKLLFNDKNKNFSFKIIPTFKNYQYIDNFSIIGFIYFFVNVEKNEKIFSLNVIKNKSNKFIFISSENHNFRFYGISELNKKNILKNLSIIKENKLNIKFKNSGLCVLQNKLNQIFNYSESVYLPLNSVINKNKNNFYIFKDELLSISINYSQYTDDIIQGLPKIEELIEARFIKNSALLLPNPSIILKLQQFENNFFNSKKINKNNINYSYIIDEHNIPFNSLKKKGIYILTKLFLFKKNLFYYENKFFIIKYFLGDLKFNNEINTIKNIKLINSNFISIDSKWEKVKQKNNKLIINLLLFLNQNKNVIIFLNKIQKNYFIYKNKTLENDFNYIINLNNNLYIFLKNIKEKTDSIFLSKNFKSIIKVGDFIDIGEPITEGLIDSHTLLYVLFKYHLFIDGTIDGTLNSLIKFQLILANSIQSIYFSQGVNISQKHIEILTIQMLSKIIITDSGDTPFFENELVPLFMLLEIIKLLSIDNNIYKIPHFMLRILSATNYSLKKDSFISSAGFQETRKILVTAAINGDIDWLRGLKENLITGKIMPVGSTFLNFKNYLDNLYFFKEE